MEAIKLENYRKAEPEHKDGGGGSRISEIKIKYAQNGFIITTIWRDGDWQQYICVTPQEVKELLEEYL